jgi:hypothetical protein
MELRYLSAYREFLAGASLETVRDFAFSLGENQHDSKRWLISKLMEQGVAERSRVTVLGSWYGTYLVPMLIDQLRAEVVNLVDVNQACLDGAKIIHRHYGEIAQLDFQCVDVNTNHELLGRLASDIVINTSCEHMDDMAKLSNVNERCLYAFQSTDDADTPEHTNIVHSEDELLLRSGIARCLFKGSLRLKNKTRYMVIGHK